MQSGGQAARKPGSRAIGLQMPVKKAPGLATAVLLQRLGRAPTQPASDANCRLALRSSDPSMELEGRLCISLWFSSRRLAGIG